MYHVMEVEMRVRRGKPGLCMRALGALMACVMTVVVATEMARADTLRISGTGSSIATAKIAAAAFLATAPGVEIQVIEPAMGSSGSIKGIIGGALDIALSARPLKERERAHGLTARELARTPFVIATAESNQGTSGFTRKELAGIYALKITSWPDGTPLRVIMRPRTDSDTDVLKSMSPEIADALEVAFRAKGMVYPHTDQEAADWIARTRGAMGSSTLALIVSEQRPLKPLAIDGVVPGVASLRAGTYPWFKSFYVVTGPKPTQTAIRFIRFLEGEAGRALLGRSGYWVPAR